MTIRRKYTVLALTVVCALLQFSFAWGQTNSPLPITHEVNLQMIQVTTADGSESATVFGSANAQTLIQNEVNKIWGQCGIRINFPSTINTYANDFAFNGEPTDYSVNARPQSHLGSILSAGDSAGAGNSDPEVLDAYFVGISPGFPQLPSNTAAGLARVDGNGTTLTIGSSLTTFAAGRAVVALVFAHELGHNFGLSHVPAGSANLMSVTGSTSQQLTPDQCSTVFTDNSSFFDGFDLLQPTNSAACDFDGDGQCDLVDLHYIYDGFGTDNAALNLDNSDGLNVVNESDIGAWLVGASSATNSYKADPADMYGLGDTNLDGNVDSTDLGLLLNAFGSSSSEGWGRGNFNADANVDSTDLGLLLNRFGFSSAANSAVVPEPGTWWTCCLGGIFLLFLRRALSGLSG